MIKGNFNIKKVEQETRSEQEKFEDLIEKSGIGSHMVFRTSKDDDDLFLDEL